MLKKNKQILDESLTITHAKEICDSQQKIFFSLISPYRGSLSMTVNLISSYQELCKSTLTYSDQQAYPDNCATDAKVLNGPGLIKSSCCNQKMY